MDIQKTLFKKVLPIAIIIYLLKQIRKDEKFNHYAMVDNDLIYS